MKWKLRGKRIPPNKSYYGIRNGSRKNHRYNFQPIVSDGGLCKFFLRQFILFCLPCTINTTNSFSFSESSESTPAVVIRNSHSICLLTSIRLFFFVFQSTYFIYLLAKIPKLFDGNTFYPSFSFSLDWSQMSPIYFFLVFLESYHDSNRTNCYE